MTSLAIELREAEVTLRSRWLGLIDFPETSSRLLKNYERSTKSHEAARKKPFVRVVSCDLVDRLLLPDKVIPFFSNLLEARSGFLSGNRSAIFNEGSATLLRNPHLPKHVGIVKRH